MTDNFDNWDDDIEEDLQTTLEELEFANITSRDWTVETIISQVNKGNIDLYPKFQRRNAWTDKRRSLLIESLIVGMPVPEIVLAENPKKKGSFIVIDGKQRLLSIVGFIESRNKDYQFWDRPMLKGLGLRGDLNKFTYEDLERNPKFGDDVKRLLNQGIRCTIITNLKSDLPLYTIFYRLNTSSVPLSTQELRQVLNKGPFADYLIDATETPQLLHEVMGTTGPDNRLRDAEIILRFMSIVLYGNKYKSNLKVFLDESMEDINDNWDSYQNKVEGLYKRFNKAITLLCDVFGAEKVGRKFIDGEWETRFNKVLFEVEVYYFMELLKQDISDSDVREKFVVAFQKLCDKDREFRDSIESSTKTVERYEIRFSSFRELMKKFFKGKDFDIPVRR